MPYTVRLSNFEGPMDLLLHMIHSAQVDIRDIFIANITDQFVEAVNGAQDYMDSASEFIGMAALLLELKARSLLPKPPDDEQESESPEELFFRRLEDYQRIKEAQEPMRALEREAGRLFARLPGEVAEGEIQLTGLTAEALLDAFNALLSRVPPLDEDLVSELIERESFTVEQGMFHILNIMRERERALFHELFTHGMDRVGVITLFLSLLELMRAGRVTARQESTGGDIVIEAGGLNHG